MKKYSLNAKILTVVFVLVMACVGTAWRGLSGLSAVDSRIDYVIDTVSARATFWTEIRDTQRLLTIRERELLMETNADEQKKVAAALDEDKKTLDSKLSELSQIASEKGKANIQGYSKNMNDWWSVHLKARELAFAGKPAEALALAVNEGHGPRKEAEKNIDTMVEANKQLMKDAADESAQEYSSTRTSMLLVSGLLMAFGIGLALYVLRQVNASVGAVIRVLEGNADQVEVASQQIASSSSGLSQSVTEQAASLEETAASVEELTSMVQRNTESAKRASDVSSTSQQSAQRGRQVVEQMTTAIGEINHSNQQIMEQVEESNRQISEITQVISEIGNKTKVINDIVFQTKLLSFNASVEAARAGEHGKGFAVVAEEVGNLAQMSGNAAKEISTMLDESIRKVENIVSETKSKVEGLIHAGRSKVETGSRIAEECGHVLDEIVTNVSEVTRMSTDIALASQEQAQGVQEINRAIGQLDQVTQTNAAASEQAASAAEELSGQARSLKGAVGSLIEAVSGSSDGHVAYKSASPSPSKKAQAPQKTAPAVVGEKPKAKSSAPASAKSKAAPKSAAPAPAKAAKKSNVVEMPARKAKPEAAPAAAEPTSKAAGSDVGVPSENDPRFQDI